MILLHPGDKPTPTYGARVLELVEYAYLELEFAVAQRLAQGFYKSKFVDDYASLYIRHRSLAFGVDGPFWDQLMKAAHTYKSERAVGRFL